MNKIWIGIDPGISKSKPGGIAMINGHPWPQTQRMPLQRSAIREWLFSWTTGREDRIFVTIEKQQGRPNMKGVNALMTHYGFLLGLLEAWRLRHEEVNPIDWQRVMLRSMPKTDRAGRKKQALERAEQLFRLGKITDGEADALLIAEYGRRIRRKDDGENDR